jgi:hypothetical protein
LRQPESQKNIRQTKRSIHSRDPSAAGRDL